jgi:3-hydroxy-9,10-secoandrosta-1,3,5(10)-triene-9,17-dione monooxygenase reductase component
MNRSMSLEPAEFRRVLGHWLTGVCIVTTRDPGGPVRGLTVNAFSALSLEPPLVLICVARTSDSHEAIRTGGAFAVNVLGADQERIARRFSSKLSAAKFDGLACRDAVTGSPILEDAIAWIDCRLREALDGGDHTIFVGDVVAADATDGDPLAFFRGGYGRFRP